MAESASILSPGKKVLLPEPMAGCPMADMADAESLMAMKDRYQDAAVVTYINSSAEVKALSDVICTSSNAVKIVQRIDSQRIIFVPDRNLGRYVQGFTSKEIILWEGFCPTHENYSAEALLKLKALHQDALVMVHPECGRDVTDLADEVLSTGHMVNFAANSKAKKIIVGTEIGMLHKLRAAAPHIEFIGASPDFICPNMKMITPEKLYASLLNEETVIAVNDSVREKAGKALNRMLELSA
jgi:quinolinate synthase